MSVQSATAGKTNSLPDHQTAVPDRPGGRTRLHQRLQRFAFRSTILYWLLGATWIVVTDRLLLQIHLDASTLAFVTTCKGWFFVTVTAGLLYTMLRTQLARWDQEATARTQAENEVQTRLVELERFNHLSVDRELRMIELKEQVNTLARQLGRPAPYPLDFTQSPAAPRRPVPSTRQAE